MKTLFLSLALAPSPCTRKILSKVFGKVTTVNGASFRGNSSRWPRPRQPGSSPGARPEGVRSVSEVYTHIALANFYLLSVTGPPMPVEIKSEDMEKTVTAKAEVIAWLKRSFAIAYTKIRQCLYRDRLKIPKYPLKSQSFDEN